MTRLETYDDMDDGFSDLGPSGDAEQGAAEVVEAEAAEVVEAPPPTKAEVSAQMALFMQNDLVAEFSSKHKMDPAQLATTLTATIFKGRPTPSQLLAFVIVANEHGLNPWLKEIYAYPQQDGGIMPMVSIDGWVRIVNSQKLFNGFSQEEVTRASSDLGGVGIKTTMYRKDWEHPVVVTEWLSENRRNTGPWRDMPMRMLGHRSYIQAARKAFGFAGIMWEDEGEEMIRRARHVEHEEKPARSAPKALDIGSLKSVRKPNPADDDQAIDNSGEEKTD